MIDRLDVFEICEHVAEAQALLDRYASNQISDPGLLAIKLRTLVSEEELLRAMHAVGYFPPSTPPEGLSTNGFTRMPLSDKTHALRERAIKHLEYALTLTEVTGDEHTSYQIERALDQMRADTWPDAIDDAPAAH
jgi:hypothetical protein